MTRRGGTTRTRASKEPIAPKLPTTLHPASTPGDDPAHDGVYLSLDYGQVDLMCLDVEDAEFERCRLTETRLAGTSMRRATFTDVAFNGCDLANVRLTDSRIFNTAISSGRLTGAAFTEVGFRDVLVDSCRADLASFRFARFKSTVFRDCNLSEANFQGADLSGARFERCKLTGAQFSGATMKGTRLTDCDLYGVAGIASFDGATVSTTDAQGLLYSLADAMGITIDP